MTYLARNSNDVYAKETLQDGWNVLFYTNPLGLAVIFIAWLCRRNNATAFVAFGIFLAATCLVRD